jgi:hypothetical protein
VLTDVPLTVLGSTAGSLKTLKHLALDFHNCNKISDVGLCSIIGGFKKMATLTNLTLNFTSCKITDVSITKMGELMNHLEMLTDLDLRFAHCEKITDVKFKRLGETLSGMVKLKSLKLNFDGCTQITDISVGPLGVGLGKLKRLTTLEFSFISCEGISDAGVLRIADAFKSMKLINLRMIFQGCKKISNGGLMKLMDYYVTPIPNLEALKLDFYGSSASERKVKAIMKHNKGYIDTEE